MDYSPPGSSVLGIFQARILEWVAIPFSRGSSQPRHWTCICCIAGRFFTVWRGEDFKQIKYKKWHKELWMFLYATSYIVSLCHFLYFTCLKSSPLPFFHYKKLSCHSKTSPKISKHEDCLLIYLVEPSLLCALIVLKCFPLLYMCAHVFILLLIWEHLEIKL